MKLPIKTNTAAFDHERTRYRRPTRFAGRVHADTRSVDVEMERRFDGTYGTNQTFGNEKKDNGVFYGSKFGKTTEKNARDRQSGGFGRRSGSNGEAKNLRMRSVDEFARGRVAGSKENLHRWTSFRDFSEALFTERPTDLYPITLVILLHFRAGVECSGRRIHGFGIGSTSAAIHEEIFGVHGERTVGQQVPNNVVGSSMDHVADGDGVDGRRSTIALTSPGKTCFKLKK